MRSPIGLAQEAPVLIADEPTSQLDLGAAIDVSGLLRELADSGLAVVLTPERHSRIWRADAHLAAAHGRTALQVAWVQSRSQSTPHPGGMQTIGYPKAIETVSFPLNHHCRATDNRTCPGRPHI